MQWDSEVGIHHQTLNIKHFKHFKHWMEKCASVSVSPCEAVFAESMADLQNKLFQQSTSILSHLAMQTSVKNTQIHRYTNSQSQSDIFYLTWQCKYFSHILAISLCHNEMAQAVYLRQIHAIPIQCIKCKCINWSSVIKWEAHFIFQWHFDRHFYLFKCWYLDWLN